MLVLTGEEDFTTGACKVLGLCRCADLGDGSQRRVQHDDLDEARECRGNDLAHEHGPRRNLHVVAKFQITHKRQRLTHRNVSEGLEDHERQRAARLDVTEYEFGQHVQANLVVCDRLDNANWQGKSKGDHHGEQKGPPG